ncbi:MAG: ROK family protein [Elusimicrobia bacterium]|nr:ROK family protein [Elusimicrobiota bacterium]
MAKSLYLGADIGGTKLAVALVDGKGRVLARDKAATPRKAGAKRILKTLEALIKATAAEGGARLKDLRAIGVGAPGIVNPEGTRIVAAPNIELAGYPIVRRLSERLGRPVVLGNDVNCGILGERWLGAAKGADDVVGIFPGTGVGGGIVAAGRLLVGAHGAAAELGHVLIEPGGPACGCGNRGCLEAIASRTAIEREIRRAIKGGKRSVVTELTGGELDVIKSKVLKKALKKGDAVVTAAMRRAGEALGAACLSLRHALDPNLFVFGGGLVEACGDFLLPIVQKAIDRDPFFRKVGACRVVEAKLGDDAVILGAVALARAAR